VSKHEPYHAAAYDAVTTHQRPSQDQVFRATSAQFLAESTRRQLDSFATSTPAASYRAPFEAWTERPAAAVRSAPAPPAELSASAAMQRPYEHIAYAGASPAQSGGVARPSSVARSGASVRCARALGCGFAVVGLADFHARLWPAGAITDSEPQQ
jgi:hypothetical protein